MGWGGCGDAFRIQRISSFMNEELISNYSRIYADFDFMFIVAHCTTIIEQIIHPVYSIHIVHDTFFVFCPLSTRLPTNSLFVRSSAVCKCKWDIKLNFVSSLFLQTDIK